MEALDWLRPAAFFGSILFALVGVAVFWISFVIVDKLTPHDLWGEIIEKKNVALAIVVAAKCIAIGLIVSAAIHG
jgi:putative membrane protein